MKFKADSHELHNHIDEKIVGMIPQILQVPSASNCQPWHIVRKENILEIYHISERAKFATFPDDLSVFGLGMLVESLCLACSTENLAPQLSFFLEDRSDEHPWLRAELREVNCSPDPLAEALLYRHTDRRHYDGGSLDDPVFEEVRREVAAFQGANLYFTDEYPDEYVKLLHYGDQVYTDWQELRGKFNKWMRFTEAEIKRTRDGQPWRSSLGGPEKWYHYFLSRIWWLQHHLDWFPTWLEWVDRLIQGGNGGLTPIYDDGAGIGCITVSTPAAKDVVAAGQLSQRIWLLLNLRGYSFQPMTNLTSVVYPLSLGTLELPPELASLLTDSHTILRKVFNFSEQELPIFCFRTGLPIGEYPANARSLRRSSYSER